MTSLPYEIVVGLEVHTQLKTRTKMFCACANRYGAEPNTLTCAVCTGQPGALPVANRQAFELAMRVGLALNATIARDTKFDRKNYFSPDLPKGYQISQFDKPITADGFLDIPSGKRVGIVRAHLEEDAGKSSHTESGSGSLVDLNRCGVPLLEIVSAPDLRSSAEAIEYLDALKLILRHTGASDCDMEKGSLRCDVNVSIRPPGATTFGQRVEIKNLNSFRSVGRAIEAEALRHHQLQLAGGVVEAETRLWDDAAGATRLMRKKESSQDYRYFPDPDLPPHAISEEWIARVRANMPELPVARAARWKQEHGLSDYDAGVLVEDTEVASYFEATTRLCGDAKAAANWIGADMFGLMNELHCGPEATGITPERLAGLIALQKSGALNVPSARKVFAAMLGNDKKPAELVAELGLGQLSDRGALKDIVKNALAANPKAVDDLKAGKQKAAGAIVGFVMKESKGRANPGLVNELIAEILPTL